MGTNKAKGPVFFQNYIKFFVEGNVFSAKAFPPKGEISSPALEAEKSAFYFKKKHPNKKFILCLSGGLDSEAMAESFLRAGAKFSASIWRYKKGLNDYDIKHAVGFCEKRKIDYEIEDFDLERFYRDKLHVLYGQKYLCDSPQVTAHIYLLEKLAQKANVAIFSPWQPPYFSYYKGKAVLQLMYFRYLAYYRFFILNKILGSPYFMICRSALLYSFLKLPLTKRIMNKNINTFGFDSYKIKSIMYEQGGFSAKPKKGKWTGFEKIKALFWREYGIYYETAFRHPLMRMIPGPKRQNLLVAPVWQEK